MATNRPGMPSTGPSTGISSGVTSIMPAQRSTERAPASCGNRSIASRSTWSSACVVGRRVEHARALERRRPIGFPGCRRGQLVEERAADAQLEVAPPLFQRRQEDAEMAQRRGRDVEGHGAAARDGVAAVLAAAERGAGRADGALGDQRRHRGALHRCLDLELRQFEAEVAQEQRRPGAAGQHHGAACDRPLLGDHAGDLARLRLERAHRAALMNACARAPRPRAPAPAPRASDSARASLGREQGALEAPLALAQQRVRLGRRQQARVELVLARVRQPVFEARELGVGLRDVGDAALGASRCRSLTSRAMFSHSRSARMIAGNSRGSRPCFRIQPQLRDDCSPAIRPFSHSTTGTPAWRDSRRSRRRRCRRR